jgi:hypothetical protein
MTYTALVAVVHIVGRVLCLVDMGLDSPVSFLVLFGSS